MQWWKKLSNRYTEIDRELSDAYNFNLERVIELQKELSEFETQFHLANQYSKVFEDIEEYNKLLTETTDNKEKLEITREIQNLEQNLADLEVEYKDLIKVSASGPDKIITEIRPATGGDEAGLFGSLLLEMYKKYAQHLKLEFDLLYLDMTTIGGIESVSFSLSGPNAYYFMEYESGVHRVQRIPKTESNGRIHTSTVTVAVLPEPTEAEVQIDENYLRIDVFRASGAGGQHVNKTESAIRLTYAHPDFDKIVISMQDERSQHKNKSKAMKILRAKIYDQIQSKLNRDMIANRKNQIGTGERYEKIRTYNFPQNRITDHRSNISIHNMQSDYLILPKLYSTNFQFI